jgi:hypothetical protein
MSCRAARDLGREGGREEGREGKKLKVTRQAKAFLVWRNTERDG